MRGVDRGWGGGQNMCHVLILVQCIFTRHMRLLCSPTSAKKGAIMVNVTRRHFRHSREHVVVLYALRACCSKCFVAGESAYMFCNGSKRWNGISFTKCHMYYFKCFVTDDRTDGETLFCMKWVEERRIALKTNNNNSKWYTILISFFYALLCTFEEKSR